MGALKLSNCPMTIPWSPNNRKQVEEAKRYYIAARKANRRILDANGDLVEKFRPHLAEILIEGTELGETEFAARIFDGPHGDRRLIWDLRDPSQVADAAKIFEEYIGKGWKPYIVEEDGKRGRRIRGFDYRAQEITFDDSGKSTKMQLSEFAKKFKEVRMLPRSYPG